MGCAVPALQHSVLFFPCLLQLLWIVTCWFFLSPLFQSLLGISRREAGNCHRIRHFENTFVVETVICKKSWSCSPDVTFPGFACTHTRTRALNPLFTHGNLSYFFYALPCLCSSNLLGLLWPQSGFSSLPATYLRCLLGLNLHSSQSLGVDAVCSTPQDRISFGSKFRVDGMAEK